ncbi:TlpA family protein disulfide reductase [Marinobacter zhejiangensis]|uniref:Thiol-disulfide isomerase or thioredoxin n=1 Tax=Marinobacter zhejiangensis TaxID=488535 RepID=A0A1I4R9V8_9GAMM|nr:TlpA disulfide reductase family protein [Marinobacter zhejiangensis]SFM49088.1 Thiol-disulfide isomerase or thioredoxin [Marinobacter zhejiangensis]
MKYPEAKQVNHRSVRGLLVAGALLLGGCGNSQLPVAEGGSVDWDDLRGQWVLVNYWAEWCKPCREEIPELNALDADAGVTVLAVNFDDIQGQALIDLGQDMGITYTMLTQDPGPDFGWDLPVGLPATFIVDPQGALVQARFGPQTEEQLRALISQ